MKKPFAALLAGLLLSVAFSASAADSKIGVVNVRDLLKNSPQVKAMQADIEKQFKPRSDKIASAQKTFEADMEKLKKNAAVMGAKERSAMQAKVSKQQQALLRSQAQFQQDLSTAQSKDMQQLLDKIQKTVGKIAKSESLGVVLAKESVIFSEDQFDITNEVAKSLK